RAPCNRAPARGGLGRAPGGHRVQDDPVRERPAVRSMAVPHFGFCPAFRAGSEAEIEDSRWRIATTSKKRGKRGQVEFPFRGICRATAEIQPVPFFIDRGGRSWA